MITRYSSHALANDLHPELLTLRLILPTENFFLGSSRHQRRSRQFSSGAERGANEFCERDEQWGMATLSQFYKEFFLRCAGYGGGAYFFGFYFCAETYGNVAGPGIGSFRRGRSQC